MSISRRALFALFAAAVALPKTVLAAARRKPAPFIVHLAPLPANRTLEPGDLLSVNFTGNAALVFLTIDMQSADGLPFAVINEFDRLSGPDSRPFFIADRQMTIAGIRWASPAAEADPRALSRQDTAP